MMWMILQHEQADDWVIATGKTTKIRDFVIKSFNYLGIEIEFRGSGLGEKGYIKKVTNNIYNLEVGDEVIAVDPKYFRPTEVDLLIGDASKAKEILVGSLRLV